ncbi:unnamed protein product [Litomosoides sigmodontis]|uniref:Uncharacterized protein n=1 Tax=Litomosoides sigmodontis TaxID=42156 RepID=A0A3P6TKC5_LITSI|nr:unnamed protein product [Litomosoides sigmodontis]
MRYLFEVDDLVPFYSGTLPGNLGQQTIKVINSNENITFESSMRAISSAMGNVLSSEHHSVDSNGRSFDASLRLSDA